MSLQIEPYAITPPRIILSFTFPVTLKFIITVCHKWKSLNSTVGDFSKNPGAREAPVWTDYAEFFPG